MKFSVICNPNQCRYLRPLEGEQRYRKIPPHIVRAALQYLYSVKINIAIM